MILFTVFGMVAAVGQATAGASSSLAWTTTPHPLDTVYEGTFNAVSCASAKFCVAAGDYVGYAPPETTMTEVWNGRSWSLAPQLGVANAVLSGVSCPSRRFCAVVGGRYNEPYNPYDPSPTFAVSTLAEIWNGKTWTRPPTPNTPFSNNQLNSVSCPNRWSCVAVGSSSTAYGGNPRALIESWNGKAWSIATSPAVGTTSSLSSVSCTRRRFCLALGDYVDASSGHHILAERWEGSTWAVTTSPGSAGSSVSCVSASFCMASGGGFGGGIERWNGSSWTTLPTPQPAFPFAGTFGDVSCTSRFFCIAITDLHGPTPSAEHSAIVVWNGSVWSSAGGNLVGIGHQIGVAGLLHSASCASRRFCFVVGGYSYAFPTASPIVLGRS